MIIGERIKELRQDKKISQKELAKIINVSQQVFAWWENGKHEPKASYIYRLALYFEVTADYLIGLENEDGTKNTNISNSFNNNSGNIKF